MDNHIINVYSIHLSAILDWLRILIYSIFGLTFAFYLALFTSDELRCAIKNLDDFQYLSAILIVAGGNVLWALFAVLSARKAIQITELIENDSDTELNEDNCEQQPRLWQKIRLQKYYILSSTLLILVNLVIWISIVTLFCRIAQFTCYQ